MTWRMRLRAIRVRWCGWWTGHEPLNGIIWTSNGVQQATCRWCHDPIEREVPA